MTPANSPYARTMGFEHSRDVEGRLVLAMPADEGKRGRPGFLHGGAIAGLLEAAAYMTLSDALGSEDRPRIKPVNVTVTYMRGALEETLFARATIARLGRRVANIEVLAWQDDEAKPVASAQMNVVLARG